MTAANSGWGFKMSAKGIGIPTARNGGPPKRLNKGNIDKNKLEGSQGRKPELERNVHIWL